MIRLLVALVLLLGVSLPVVAQKPKSEKEIKKELLARPSEVEMGASAEQVKAALVDAMTSRGWEMSTDTQFQMTFSKTASGGSAWGMMLGASMAGSHPSNPAVDTFYTFIPRDKSTVVRFRCEMSYTVSGGRTIRQNAGEKDYKPEILKILDGLNEQFSQGGQLAVSPRG